MLSAARLHIDKIKMCFHDKTKYLVLPDPDGKRVGSGGATLQVLRKLAEQEDIAGDFHNKRILVIHSGGDSKRVPAIFCMWKAFFACTT